MSKLLAMFIASLVLSACQTDRLKEVSGIEKGMTKSEVLDRAGGPQRTDRKRDQDVWTYIIPRERSDVLKEVDFSQGRVTYVGDPIVAGGPSAEEQDRLNEESNAKSEAQRRRENLLQEIGSSQPGKASGNASTSSTVAGDADDDTPAKPTPKPVFVPLDGGGGAAQ